MKVERALGDGLEGALSLVHVTSRCNNRCVSCPMGDDRSGSCDVPSDEVMSALERHRGAGTTKVAFVGGEPTLVDELPEYIVAARSMGFSSVYLRTNGRRLTYPRYLRQLRQAKLDGLNVSVHGSRPEIHEHHTQARESFRQTITGLRGAVRAGIPVGVTSVVTRSNYRHLADLVRFLGARGVDAIRLSLAVPEGRAARYMPAVVPRLAMVAPHARAAAAFCERHGIYLSVAGLPRCLHGDARFEPAVGFSRAAVSMNDGCDRCIVRDECFGVHRGYTGAYGFAEIGKPLLVLDSAACEPDKRADRFVGI